MRTMRARLARALRVLKRRWRGTRDRGAATAEYAVVLVAATAFGTALFKIVTSQEVRNLLLTILKKGLHLSS
ncbi:hypothetical protein GCM10009678_41230 [Actinomadura kijaniata]|uniref:DUF4244 domain-containing protein n=2 Tax=Actinomadura TaxID=1988 RepID=A0A7W3LM54_ACTNM|nr:DUF4244 domain-containing protein [Actinomadura namibiensis]MBA8950647.1 hypothetical protein [Actinomadura namibiensis]